MISDPEPPPGQGKASDAGIDIVNHGHPALQQKDIAGLERNMVKPFPYFFPAAGHSQQIDPEPASHFHP